MTLCFAYGSNMSRDLMQRRCPNARALGCAQILGWSFVITSDGYGSIVPLAGGVVHGVLWRLSPRDRAALDHYEDVTSGVYRRCWLPVAFEHRRVPALVYVGRGRPGGRAKPGYQAIVVDAARDWSLPPHYIGFLSRVGFSHWRSARPAKTGETG